MKDSTHVVLHLNTMAYSCFTVLTKESQSLTNLLMSVIGLSLHAPVHVGDGALQVDQNIIGQGIVSAQEVVCL